jgi:ubiquinone/menaquinone biosynthesis C-methylase UbiE
MDSRPRAGEETYNFGYGIMSDLMAQKTVGSHASFILPSLRPGMRLLDCGCGPGSITIGLAQLRDMGEVHGIDIASGEIDKAKRSAATDAANVHFQVGDIYRIPFDSNSFDVVLAHSVLQHLADPNAALQEMRRVLRPGGVVALCDDEWGSLVYYPSSPSLQRAYELYLRYWQHCGGDPYLPRRYIKIIRDNGFNGTTITGALHLRRTRESTLGFGKALAHHLGEPGFKETVVRCGWADASAVAQMQEAFVTWGQSPDAFHALAVCAVVARKKA